MIEQEPHQPSPDAWGVVGVGDEGDLASDYFGMLADGVVEKYRTRMTEGGGKRKKEDEDDRDDEDYDRD